MLCEQCIRFIQEKKIIIKYKLLRFSNRYELPSTSLYTYISKKNELGNLKNTIIITIIVPKIMITSVGKTHSCTNIAYTVRRLSFTVKWSNIS